MSSQTKPMPKKFKYVYCFKDQAQADFLISRADLIVYCGKIRPKTITRGYPSSPNRVPKPIGILKKFSVPDGLESLFFESEEMYSNDPRYPYLTRFIHVVRESIKPEQK